MEYKRDPLVRCERCLGMGYKGGWRRSKWKIETCRGCQGSGQRPETDKQRPHTRAVNYIRD